jgi:hypothetical protein
MAFSVFLISWGVALLTFPFPGSRPPISPTLVLSCLAASISDSDRFFDLPSAFPARPSSESQHYCCADPTGALADSDLHKNRVIPYEIRAQEQSCPALSLFVTASPPFSSAPASYTTNFANNTASGPGLNTTFCIPFRPGSSARGRLMQNDNLLTHTSVALPIPESHTGFLLVGLGCLAMINVVFVIEIELALIRDKNPDPQEDNEWGFGQVLALLLLAVPLGDFVWSIFEIRKRLRRIANTTDM